eukprot:SAG22_NODE_1_length_62449_cov_158.689270_33_plen_155_part_00
MMAETEIAACRWFHALNAFTPADPIQESDDGLAAVGCLPADYDFEATDSEPRAFEVSHACVSTVPPLVLKVVADSGSVEDHVTVTMPGVATGGKTGLAELTVAVVEALGLPLESVEHMCMLVFDAAFDEFFEPTELSDVPVHDGVVKFTRRHTD